MAAKAKLDAFLKQLDDQLSQVAILNKATEKVKVPFFKAYLVLGLGFLVVLLIAIGVADDFLTDLIGTAFPAFASLKLAYSFSSGDATSEQRSQVTQWLTYWVLYALIDCFECVFDAVGIPFFDLIKLAGLVYLFAPGVNGAEKVFKILQPNLGKLFKPQPVVAGADIRKPE